MFSFVASRKLRENGVGMKLFLEDGYEVDEDDILVSSITAGQTLILSKDPPRNDVNAQVDKKKGWLKF